MTVPVACVCLFVSPRATRMLIELANLIWDHSTVSAVSIALLVSVTFKVVQFYWNVQTLPPGPLPLPLIGNGLSFVDKESNLLEIITRATDKFGPVFTFWLGPMPNIVINDAKLAKEAYSRVELSGRPLMKKYNEIAYGKDAIDIINSDFNREWEVLRKVAHSAARKSAVSKQLPVIIDSKVKTFLAEINEKDGKGPFEPSEYIEFLMMSLLATIAFGKELRMSDLEFQILNRALKIHTESVELLGALLVYFPGMKYVYKREQFDEFVNALKTQREYGSRMYKEHLDTYVEGTIRDFTDAMIFAKREAEAEDSNDKKYLKDQNVVNAVLDLFGAGSETTKLTLLWTLLLLANYPEHQKSIRDEVEAALGSEEMPTYEHRSQCNLLQAFILEVMRFRPILPLGVPHKAVEDTEIGGQKIKKGVSVMITIQAGANSKEVWGDPEVFRPERFLDENKKFIQKPNQVFSPFGGGRRVCLGEKLALANLFFVLAGVLHQTKGQLFSLPGGQGSADLTYVPKMGFNIAPLPYKLICTPVTEEEK